jgi:hypothetical protein
MALINAWGLPEKRALDQPASIHPQVTRTTMLPTQLFSRYPLDGSQGRNEESSPPGVFSYAVR